MISSMFITFIDNLKIVLSKREKVYIQGGNRERAAVLAIILEIDRKPHILFTKRTEQLQNHKGQISFPGGAQHDTDINSTYTALRETYEEIGIPPDCIGIIGELDDTVTLVSNYIITPYVAYLTCSHPLKINRYEVEEIIQVPLSVLLDKSNYRQEQNTSGNGYLYYYFYYYQGKEIWGATARILNDLMDVVLRNGLDRHIIGF